ncbi:MAG: LptF/LptG family permease, partial [Myxococcota bacterium]|nr:LptF/LptG family permease [Myxococcota bacterium]
LMSADPSSLRVARLREYIAARERRGASAVSQRALLYSRFGDWISIALLVAAAIPLGLSVERTRSLGRSAAYATATLVGFLGLRGLEAVLSAQEVVPPHIAVSATLLALASFAAVGFVRAPR